MTAAPAEAADRAAAAELTPDTRASLRLVGWLAASWAMLVLVGFLSLRTADALGASNRVSADRAAFVSVNVAALNGFVLDFAKPDDFSAAVRAVFVLQTLAGVLLGLVGGGVLLARLLGRPYTDGQITRTALGMIAVAFVVGGLTGLRGDLFTAGFRAVAALGCGGVTFGDMPRPGLAFSLVFVPLGIAGSFGVVVLTDIAAAIKHRRPLADHAWRTVALTACVYVVGMAVMIWTAAPRRHDLAPTLVRADARLWSAHALGTPVEFTSDWPPGTFWPTLAVAVVGVGTAGSAGAFGLAWLVTATGRVRHVVANGLTAQVVLASAGLAALVRFEPTLPPLRRLLLVVSATMNLGLSHQPLGITGVGLCTLAVLAAAAKVLPLVVFALALRHKDST